MGHRKVGGWSGEVKRESPLRGDGKKVSTLVSQSTKRRGGIDNRVAEKRKARALKKENGYYFKWCKKTRGPKLKD